MSSDNLCFQVIAEKRHRENKNKTYNMHYAFFLMFNFLNQMLIFELMQTLSMEMIFNIILMNSMN